MQYQQLGWGFQILPYLELQTLWNPPNAPTGQQRIDTLRTTQITAYSCPTRRGGGSNLVLSGIYTVDNEGEHTGWASWDSTYIQMTDYASSCPSHDAGWHSRMFGSLPYAQGINVGSISDGTSNQFLVGERYVDSRQYPFRANGQDVGYVDGWDVDNLRHTSRWNDGWGGGSPSNPTPYEILVPIPDTKIEQHDPDVWRFGGPHPQRLLMCFADATVHGIPFNVDPIIWWRLSDRRDGAQTEIP
jgi:hypothetical protein